jgi:hypothetical protein
MSPILVILGSLLLLLSGVGLIMFVAAARRTNEDWAQHPATQRLDAELRRAEAQAIREAQQSGHSRIGEA